MIYKDFESKEFDTPGEPGTGEKMQPEFMRKLDFARELAGVPFVVTSGYRSAKYNAELIKKNYPASPNSSHLRGWAADIRTRDGRERFQVLNALIRAGFDRIGIGSRYIHVDADPKKPSPRVWTYPKTV